MFTQSIRKNRILHENAQFILFLFIGVINTLFGYAVFCLFIWLNFHYTIALLIATCLGVIFNFKTIGSVVFKSHNNRLILRFFLVYMIIYAVSIGVIHMEGFFLTSMYLKGFISTLLTAILSYNLNKKFVFHQTA